MMSLMDISDFLIQFIYLLVYSSSLLSGSAAAGFRKKMNGEIDKPLRQTILSTASCSVLLSIQVFLGAVGFLEVMPEHFTAKVIFTTNISVLFSICLLWSAITKSSFLFRPAARSNLIIKTAGILIPSLFVLVLLLQAAILFFRLNGATLILGYVQGTAALLFMISMTGFTVRMFIPMNTDRDPAGLSIFRIFLVGTVLLPILLAGAGILSSSLLAPSGFLILNVLSILLIYKRINRQNTTPAADPASICRELGLSKRETEVAGLLSKGLSYKEIAGELFISISTTQTHVGRIYSKLGINNKTELANMLNQTLK